MDSAKNLRKTNQREVFGKVIQEINYMALSVGIQVDQKLGDNNQEARHWVPKRIHGVYHPADFVLHLVDYNTLRLR